MRNGFFLGAAFILAACSSDDESGSGLLDGGALDGAADMASDSTPAALRCEFDDLLERPFSEGPYGIERHDVAEDFSLALTDGSTFTLSEHWNGCDSYLFLPDTLIKSDIDPVSLWESAGDVRELAIQSPANVHYFFVSRRSSEALAEVSTAAMDLRIADVLDSLPADKAAHWGERMHVVAARAGALESWVGDVMGTGMGLAGFAIDRQQTLRGIGSLADVNRTNASPGWPFDANLVHAMHEALRYNYEARRQERLDSEDVTIVSLWSGEILEEYEDTTVTLPDAAEMAQFDTFEIDVTMRCPDAGTVEFNNCGAWDYIASFQLYDAGEDAWIELSRFITTYHREGRLMVDATPMLVHLLDGGSRTFRWSFAPSWNTQPTETWLDLRFSNQAKGYKPVEATFLWNGGRFDDAYNTIHPPVDVPIPGDAARVELWAVITGHGGTSPNNCAEFCDHHHEFTVDGIVYLLQHPAVGNPTGCVAEIENGAVPNQWGTWWYGRGGWCPGQQVEPYVVDVTADVTLGGTATLDYRGLLFGTDPSGDNGNIVMISYLVVYR